MESSDTLRRIVVRHALILTICTLLGAGAATALVTTQEPLYMTSARVALGGWDPNDSVKAKTLADSARAIATSERVVRGAIVAAGAPRDIQDVTARVSLTAAGSSSVVDVAVADEDPVVAAKLANAVAEGVIDVRWNLLRGGIADLLADVDVRNTALAEQLTALEDEISAARPETQEAQLALERYGAALQQRSDLADERRRLISLGALQPRASVIDVAEVPSAPQADERTVGIVLGIVAGILVGLSIAAVLEILRPSVSGADAIARAAEAPWLGTLPVRPALANDGDLEAAANGVRLVAASADVGALTVVPVGLEAADATSLGSALAAGGGTVRAAGVELGSVSGVTRVVIDPRRERDEGIVLLAPSTLHRKDLAPVHHLREATGWPIVGVLLARRMKRAGRAAKAVEAAAATAAANGADGSSWPEAAIEAGPDDRTVVLDGRTEATRRS